MGKSANDEIGAKLRKLSGSRPIQIDLINADLRGVDLCEVDLSQAKLSGAKLDKAKYNSQTKWPVGFDPVEAGAQASSGSSKEHSEPSQESSRAPRRSSGWGGGCGRPTWKRTVREPAQKMESKGGA